MQPGQRILFIVQSPTPTHCNHTFRLVACCSFAGVKRTTRPERNQSHSRSLGRIELAFNHRWASEQFPSTKFPTWLWSTRGTGFQALSQECRELALNQGPLVYEAEALTAGPLTLYIHTCKAKYKVLSAIHPSASYSNTSYVSVYYDSPGYTVV